MPLTKKGTSILREMIESYTSTKKGTSVFYASIRKGTVKGAEKGAK